MADLQKIAGRATEANQKITDRVAMLETQLRSLMHRLDVLEDAPQGAKVPSDPAIDNQSKDYQSLGTKIKSSDWLSEGGAEAIGANTPGVAINDRLLSTRQRAEELVGVEVPDGRGGWRVLTRAEIETALIVEFRIPRNSAQSAATKAVKRIDPDNASRRTHKTPVARRIDDTLRNEMQRLSREGIGVREIALRLGADEKTIRIHLRRPKPSTQK
jgi:hypothetical protein